MFLNGGTNNKRTLQNINQTKQKNYIHRPKKDIFLRAGIQINIIETK